MALKKYNESFEDDEIELGKEWDLPNDIDEQITDNDVIESLLSSLRKIIKNSGIPKFFVFKDDDDDNCINIQFVLKLKERINGIMKIMNLVKKIQTDILIQYKTEFDLWESKLGDPLMTIKFYYDESVDNTLDDDDDIDDDIDTLSQSEPEDPIYSFSPEDPIYSSNKDDLPF